VIALGKTRSRDRQAAHEDCSPNGAILIAPASDCGEVA